jgi:hypothetical protein
LPLLKSISFGLALGVAATLVGLYVAHRTAAPKYDGLDPADPRYGCESATPVQTLHITDTSGVTGVPERTIGELSLVISNRCPTAWGRFIPDGGLLDDPRGLLILRAVRLGDNTVQEVRQEYGGGLVVTKMLNDRKKCVYITFEFIQHAMSSKGYTNACGFADASIVETPVEVAGRYITGP